MHKGIFMGPYLHAAHPKIIKHTVVIGQQCPSCAKKYAHDDIMCSKCGDTLVSLEKTTSLIDCPEDFTDDESMHDITGWMSGALPQHVAIFVANVYYPGKFKSPFDNEVSSVMAITNIDTAIYIRAFEDAFSKRIASIRKVYQQTHIDFGVIQYWA